MHPTLCSKGDVLVLLLFTGFTTTLPLIGVKDITPSQ